MTKVFYYKTRKLYRFALVFLLGTVLVTGCKDDFDGYFDYPSNIEGPIYEQLSSRSNLSEFVKAIDKVPLMKSIINTSGLYTVFAPTNEAIEAYFLTQTRYPGKSGIEDFDVEKKDASGVKTDSILLCQFIEAHIAIDMYFHYDFKRFIPDAIVSTVGFSYDRDRNRYSTRYRDQKYIDTVAGEFILNSKTNERTPRICKVRPNSKSVTVYPYKYLRRQSIVNEFASLYGLKSTPKGEDLFVNGVKVIEADIPAVNGAIHIVDGVIEPKENLDMMIKRLNPTYWSIFQQYAEYVPNMDVTETEGVSKFDTIFDKIYTSAVDISNEYSNNLVTVLLPGKGFEDFVRDSILPAYNIVMNSKGILRTPMDSLPPQVTQALVYQFLVEGVLWNSQLKYGFRNIFNDTLQTENQVKRPKNLTVTGTKIASNGLVYTLPDDVRSISSIFRTVAKVPMMDRRYKWFLTLSNRSIGGLSPFGYLMQHYKKYTVFMPTRDAFRTAPSAIYEMRDDNEILDLYRNGETIYPIVSDSILKNLIIPDVILTPDSLKKFQFRKTLLGGYLQIANNQVIFSYNDPTTKVVTDYISVLPTVPRDAANPDGYILTENGIVYPLIDRVPMPASLTLSGYLTKNRSTSNSNFYKLLYNTSVNADLIAEDLKVKPVVIADKNDKGNITDPNEKLWAMLISEGNEPQEMYTVFYPTDAALKAYATACNAKTSILPTTGDAFTSGNVYWAKIARQLIIKTRVYTDGTRVQNFYDIYSNPVEGKDNLFQTLNYKKIVKVNDYFNDNEYTNLKLSFENGTITLTDPISGNTAKTTNVKNIECVNGVFHEIDAIPFPVMTTKAEWDNFISRPIPVE